MDAVLLASNFYSALATAVLFLHGLFILWVIFGTLLVRSRPILRWLHIASLVWGILTELLPWPCPFIIGGLSMFLTYLIVTVLTAGANIFSATLDFIHYKQV